MCDEQTGTTCGYAKQNKLWVRDPFGNFWELYRIDADVKPEAIRTSLEGAAARPAVPACASHPVASLAWEHFVTATLPARIPHDDGSLDEVRLTGSFNANLTNEDLRSLLAESLRMLKPGGTIATHGLMADCAFEGPQPKLPGLAAMVSRVPVQTEPLEALAAAGFVELQILKYSDKPWFTHAGAGLREVRIVGRKPTMPEAGSRMLLYKGPFPTVVLDGGLTLERGRRTTVPLATWETLRAGAAAEQFLFLEPGTTPCVSS